MADEKKARVSRNTLKTEKKEIHIPPAPGGIRANFAMRMGAADYVTYRRYDAVKNAFLSYRRQNTGKTLCSRITNSGETFSVGKTIYAKLCLVSGYLRLFLALDPQAYNQKKYHHKDYTGVIRYAKIPFMIKLSSDRQVRYALELIGDLMRANGFEPDASYCPKDQAGIFMQMGARRLDREASIAASVSEREGEAGEPAAIDVRLPVRAKVVDREGGKRGKIRSSVWYGEEGEALGEFRKEKTNVFLYRNEVCAGYVDKNDNILSLADRYLATIRRFRWLPILIIVLILAFLTAVSVLLSAYFMTRSSDYAPVLFIADEHGTSWEQFEDLPVFVNERFGDRVIAPGMRGSYRFILENRNADALEFSLSFEEVNEYGIGLCYRLKRDNTYVSGTDGYVRTAELGLRGMTIEAESTTLFEIEWYWKDNDAVDTAAGENEAQYTLQIEFVAAVRGRE